MRIRRRGVAKVVSNNGGFTILESTIVFALFSIFFVLAFQVLASAMRTYFRISDDAVLRSIADTVGNTIEANVGKASYSWIDLEEANEPKKILEIIKDEIVISEDGTSLEFYLSKSEQAEEGEKNNEIQKDMVRLSADGGYLKIRKESQGLKSDEIVYQPAFYGKKRLSIGFSWLDEMVEDGVSITEPVLKVHMELFSEIEFNKEERSAEYQEERYIRLWSRGEQGFLTAAGSIVPGEILPDQGAEHKPDKPEPPEKPVNPEQPEQPEQNPGDVFEDSTSDEIDTRPNFDLPNQLPLDIEVIDEAKPPYTINADKFPQSGGNSFVNPYFGACQSRVGYFPYINSSTGQLQVFIFLHHNSTPITLIPLPWSYEEYEFRRNQGEILALKAGMFFRYDKDSSDFYVVVNNVVANKWWNPLDDSDQIQPLRLIDSHSFQALSLKNMIEKAVKKEQGIELLEGILYYWEDEGNKRMFLPERDVKVSYEELAQNGGWHPEEQSQSSGYDFDTFNFNRYLVELGNIWQESFKGELGLSYPWPGAWTDDEHDVNGMKSRWYRVSNLRVKGPYKWNAVYWNAGNSRWLDIQPLPLPRVEYDTLEDEDFSAVNGEGEKVGKCLEVGKIYRYRGILYYIQQEVTIYMDATDVISTEFDRNDNSGVEANKVLENQNKLADRRDWLIKIFQNGAKQLGPNPSDTTGQILRIMEKKESWEECGVGDWYIEEGKQYVKGYGNIKIELPMSPTENTVEMITD